uniref:Fibronectin type-III domain-containing protein n=1 Tax=Xenopus tropicalis TaxID=8364 RepID=A4IGL0_XENTR|eukprot:NP_001135470.1 collagen alpha-1(XIV) chain precursor [Xenopus tropicalis]
MKTERNLQTIILLSFLAIAVFFASPGQSQVTPPTRMRYHVVSQDSVQISWKASKDKVKGYKLLITPKSGGKTNQLNLQNSATKAIIQRLDPDRSYIVQIIAFNEDDESTPVQGEFRMKDLEKKRKLPDPSKTHKKDKTGNNLPEGGTVLFIAHWTFPANVTSDG